MGSGGVNDYEQPFMVARDVENYLGLPEPEADLTVFHVPAHKISTLQVIRKQMLWQKYAL